MQSDVDKLEDWANWSFLKSSVKKHQVLQIRWNNPEVQAAVVPPKWQWVEILISWENFLRPGWNEHQDNYKPTMPSHCKYGKPGTRPHSEKCCQQMQRNYYSPLVDKSGNLCVVLCPSVQVGCREAREGPVAGHQGSRAQHWWGDAEGARL